MKKTVLWYVGLVVLILSVMMFSFPDVLGWNRGDIWMMGMPLSQICLLLFPTLALVGLEMMYLGDKQAIKRRMNEKNSGKNGGEHRC